MWGMNDLDTALFIGWFVLAGVWVFTLAYYGEQVAYFKGRWVDAESYTASLMKLYRGELTDGTEEETDKELETGD